MPGTEHAEQSNLLYVNMAHSYKFSNEYYFEYTVLDMKSAFRITSQRTIYLVKYYLGKQSYFIIP
jgi:hypothetical protein